MSGKRMSGKRMSGKLRVQKCNYESDAKISCLCKNKNSIWCICAILALSFIVKNLSWYRGNMTYYESEIIIVILGGRGWIQTTRKLFWIRIIWRRWYHPKISRWFTMTIPWYAFLPTKISNMLVIGWKLLITTYYYIVQYHWVQWHILSVWSMTRAYWIKWNLMTQVNYTRTTQQIPVPSISHRSDAIWQFHQLY
jgi:hypothetical protein